MIKVFMKILIISGIALLVNCSQQNPVAAKDGDYQTVGSAFGTVSELESIADGTTGRLYMFMKNNSNSLYYQYQNANLTWPGTWTSLGSAVSSNIVTLQGHSNSPYKTMVFFRSGTSDFYGYWFVNGTFTKFNYQVGTGTPPLNQGPGPSFNWATNSNLAAVIMNDGNWLVLGRSTSDNTLYGCNGNGALQISGSPIGNYIAATTLSTNYGTNGLVQVFAIAVNGASNLITISQTASPANNLGTWQTYWTNLGGTVYGNIAVGKDAAGYNEVFISNYNANIYHQFQTSATTWSGWSQLDGNPSALNGIIQVGTNADNRLEIFFTNPSTPGYLSHEYQVQPNSYWSGPATLTGSNGVGEPNNGKTFSVGRNGAINATSGRILNCFTTVSGAEVYYINQSGENTAWNNWTYFLN